MSTAADKCKVSEVERDGKTFISDMLEQCKVHRVENVKIDCVMRVGNKDVVAMQLVRALQLIETQHNLIINQRENADTFKEEIIKLQRNLIEAQHEQVQAIRSGICEDALELVEDILKESVKETMNESVRSYSDAVQTGVGESPGNVFTPETLKKVVKEVAVEEELSRNVMVFGLPEEESADKLDDSVGEVFQLLGEKPRFEAVRLGKKKDSVVRPVRVVFSSAQSAQNIIGKSRNLRHTDKFKKVFLSPDRTVEEREKQKGLVLQLKKRMEEDPQSKHFIRNGQIISANKNGVAT